MVVGGVDFSGHCVTEGAPSSKAERVSRSSSNAASEIAQMEAIGLCLQSRSLIYEYPSRRQI